MILSRIIKTITSPERFVKTILGKSENLIYDIKNRKRKFTFGDEFSDLKFYEIGFHCGWNGLGWIILHVMEHLEYADRKKYIPIINMCRFRNQYVSADNSDTENIWMNWFEQPTQYKPENILKSKHVIKCKRAISPNRMSGIAYSDYKNMERIKKLRLIYNKYIKINADMRERILETQNQIIGDKKVLGIMCRGTDFSKLKPHLHPIQPNPQDVIDEAETVMKKHNCSHIFLSTEDKDIYVLFHKKFGDALLAVPQTRFSAIDINKQNPLANLSTPEKRKEIAFSYLTSMYILSKCPCFISGITGGSLLVTIMSDGFEYEHFWDLGIYSNEASISACWKNFIDELKGVKMRE